MFKQWSNFCHLLKIGTEADSGITSKGQRLRKSAFIYIIYSCCFNNIIFRIERVEKKITILEEDESGGSLRIYDGV